MILSLYNETLKCLRQDAILNNLYYLTNPHLLYLSQKQSKAYLQVMENPRYSSSFHNATVALIENNITQIFNGLNTTISLVDLGPGYPDKALPIAKFFYERNQPLYYFPVDINVSFLELAKKVMAPYVDFTTIIPTKFEECFLPDKAHKKPIYLMIGLTFMNFESGYIIQLLKKIANEQGKIMLASELITGKNPIDKIIKSYEIEEAKAFAFNPLANLGIERAMTNCLIEFKHSKITFKFILLENYQREGVNFKKGDEIITAMSYRYTLDGLKTILNKNFVKFNIFLSKDESTAFIVGN